MSKQISKNVIDAIMVGLGERLTKIKSNVQISYQVNEKMNAINIYVGNNGCSTSTLETIIEYLYNQGIFVYWIGIKSKKFLDLCAFQRRE
jgi:hypothetical protein